MLYRLKCCIGSKERSLWPLFHYSDYGERANKKYKQQKKTILSDE